MKPRIIFQIDPSAEHDREVIERLANESMAKVDAYLRKYDDIEDAEVRIEITVKKNHDDSFYGKLRAMVDGQLYFFEREKFFRLDDLIHHAFQHLKEQLSAK